MSPSLRTWTRLERSLAVAAALAAWTVVLSAQDQQAPPVFRAGVDVVQLEVEIFDADDQFVHGLTKDQIEVKEDGVKQDVVDLREIPLDDGSPMPVWARAVPPDIATNDLTDRRLIGIILDDLHCCGAPTMTDRGMLANIKATAEFVVDSMGPHDLASIALTHELMGIQPFTADRDALRATIGRFSPQSEVGCRPMPPVPLLTGDMARLLAMSGVPFKMVVVIAGSLAGEMPYCPARSYTIPDTGRTVTATVGPNPGKEADPLGLPPVPIYRLHVDARGITPFYDIDHRGPDPFLRGLRRDQIPGNPDRRDVGAMVEKMLEQNDSYYLLGFRTSKPTTDGKYRHIEIKVPGHKDYQVRSRVGYIRPKAAPKPGSGAALDPELARAPVTVASLLPHNEITLQAAPAAFALPGGRTSALVIPLDLAHTVTEDVPSGSETIELRTLVYAASDPKQDLHRTVTIAVPAGIKRVTTSLFARVDLAPDRYELWVTARDGRTTRIGSVSADVDIPDRTAHAITLSGVALGSPPTAAAPLPAELAGVLPIIPTPDRTFGQSEEITAFLQVYQGRATSLAAAELTIKVLDDQGTVKFNKVEVLAPERFSTDRVVNYQFALPLAALTGGRYLLSIEGRLGDRISPRRDVPFNVR